MIYYRKTLFGSGPKLTAVHAESEKARIPTTMPFGKHKGLLLADVPSNYKQWLLTQGDIDPYLQKAFEA